MASGIFYPVASNDDGFIYSGNSSLDATAAQIVFGDYYSSFIRFNNVTIPKGSTINSASLKFKNEMQRIGNNCNANIYFEDEDDPAVITTYSDFNSRNRTSAVPWNSIAQWDTDVSYDSPDITSILQTIIDRTGWVSGQHISVFVENNGSSSGAIRSGYSYDNNPSYVTELHIDWTVPDIDITLDFDSSPLSLTVSGAAEALFLDFAAAPLTFYPHIEFGAVEVNFEDHPFEFTLSASLTEMFYLDMGTAPLLITTSFDPAFEGRGENIIEAELPALTMTSVLAVRSLRIDADLPELTMASSLLVGEILSIEAELPALEIEAGLTVHIFGSITAELPGLECRAHLIVGQLISIDAELPALTMVSHIFQVPKMAIGAILPALYMTSSLRVRAAEAKFRTTVLNLKNMAVTKYEDFNFNSLCYFNGVYLGANENGIYILGGDTDAGADIDWSFKTPKIDFLNAIPADIWLSLRNSQALAVKVEQNEDIEHPYTYLVNADTDPKIHMERVKLGRGLDARVIQMTVSGTGAVDLNGISIVTNPLKKSKR